jgi:hypothetical protein
MQLGQITCLGNSSDEFDGSGEQSRAMFALLFCFETKILIIILYKYILKACIKLIFKYCIRHHFYNNVAATLLTWETINELCYVFLIIFIYL